MIPPYPWICREWVMTPTVIPGLVGRGDDSILPPISGLVGGEMTPSYPLSLDWFGGCDDSILPYPWIGLEGVMTPSYPISGLVWRV